MGKFVKGQSGNPGGAPKGLAEVKELARQHAPTAIQTLVDICTDTKAPPAARVGASSALLDRGFGKPPQAITGEDGSAVKIEYSDETRVKALAAFLARTTAK